MFKIDLRGLTLSETNHIQEIALSIGYRWNNMKSKIIKKNFNFLYLHKDGKMTYGNNKHNFYITRKSYLEIDVKMFLNLSKEVRDVKTMKKIINKKLTKNKLNEALKHLKQLLKN